MASQVLGNLIAALILGPLSQGTYYVVMSIAAFSGTAVFLALRKPVKGVEDIKNLSASSEVMKVGNSNEERSPDESVQLIKQEEEYRQAKAGGFV